MNPAFARHQPLPSFDRQNPPGLPRQLAVSTKPCVVQGKFAVHTALSEGNKFQTVRGTVTQQIFPAEESLNPSART